MPKRPYRLEYIKATPDGAYRGSDHFSRATFATLDAARQYATGSLNGRKTWGPDRSGFVYVAVAIWCAGQRIAEVS